MPQNGISRFIGRLQLYGSLSPQSIEAIRALPWRVIKRTKLSYVLREGDIPQEVSILVAGFAQRQKHTSDGTRQIVSFSVPGDPLDFDCLFLNEADFSVQMSTSGTIACGASLSCPMRYSTYVRASFRPARRTNVCADRFATVWTTTVVAHTSAPFAHTPAGQPYRSTKSP